MKEIFSMWSNTKMIVLTAICAALYAGLMLPFKIAIIVPGFSEIRPGIAVPLTCSFLFGPAAAWGSGIGNVIGDIWGGMIGPGSFFGFFGNFLMAFIPYKLWRTLSGSADIEVKTPMAIAIFVLTCVTASCGCAVVIGWGLDLLKFVPLRLLTNVIAVNNSVFTVLLGLPLTLALYKRVRQWGLFYADVMKGEQGAVSPLSRAGAVMMILCTIGGVFMANLGVLNPGFSVFILIIAFASLLL